MIGNFCRSVKLGIRTGYNASRSAYQAARPDGRHTNWPSLWTNPTRRTGPASSMFSRLTSRFPRRKPAISFTTTANQENASSQQLLSLLAWIPPYYSPKFVTQKDCSQALTAIGIIKEKIDMEITKLTEDQISLQTSVWVVGGSLPFCDKLISSVRRRGADEYQ